MQSRVGHVTIYIHDAQYSYGFYQRLFECLEFEEIFHEDLTFAFIKNGVSLWFEEANELFQKYGYNRKRIGLNHIAFRVSSKVAVDKFNQEFLIPNRLKTLYESPKLFPDYDKDYYAVYFEDPDRIKLEVSYYP